jgi:hypothetical protein
MAMRSSLAGSFFSSISPAMACAAFITLNRSSAPVSAAACGVSNAVAGLSLG